MSKESRTTLLLYSPLCIVILIRLRQFSTLEIAVWNLVARRNVIWMQIIKVVNLALNGRIQMGPNSFWSCLFWPQCIFLIFSKIEIVKNIFEIWNPMKTNIVWPHCLWLYSCRGSESTLESTYTSSISKVVNGRMAHQGTTISMCSCFRDASFSFWHLSLSKVKRTSQVIT